MKSTAKSLNQGSASARTHLTMESPLGKLIIVQEDNEIRGIIQRQQPVPKSGIGTPDHEGNEVLVSTKEQFLEFFTGERRELTVPFTLEGTTFQKSVWEALLTTVDYGRTAYYSDIASVIGKPRALQAVGTAIGMNPLSVLIPCHRVIAQSGKVNYAGGIKNKEYLLSLESKYSK